MEEIKINNEMMLDKINLLINELSLKIGNDWIFDENGGHKIIKDENGKVKHIYNICRNEDGFFYIEFMPINEYYINQYLELKKIFDDTNKVKTLKKIDYLLNEKKKLILENK